MIQRTPINMRPPGFKGLSSRVMDIVQIYKWPGNIRELRNFMTRIMIMQDEGEAARELETKISNSEKPRGPFDHPQQSHGAAGMRTVIRDARHHAEAQMIQSALDTSGWNRRRAAQRLEISYRALLYKIQQYRLSPDSREPLGATLSGKAGI
jgi:DNA-binding NtrC family response regulator